MAAIRRRTRQATLGGLLLWLGVLAACAGQKAAAPASPATPATPLPALTVPAITTMLEQGQQPAVIIGEIQRTGTVYRMTSQQAEALRASGSPASLVSFMKLTYVHATEQNPALAKSDEQWHRVGDYWYGGTPFGWPAAWVIGAPRVGEAVRGR